MVDNVQTQEAAPVTDDLDAFTSEFYGQNTQAEADPPASGDTEDEVETEQDEAGEVVESEEETNDEVVEDEPEPEAPKPKPTVQDRINELVRQREEAKREVEALRREFEEKLAQLAPKQPEKVEPGEPKPDDVLEDGTPKYDLGEFDPQYIRDLTKYTLEQERKVSEQVAAERAKEAEAREYQEALVSTWNEKVESAKTSYPDFMEKGQELLNGFTGLDESYATYLSTVLMSMDKGPDVLYYLASNPAEAVTIVNSGAQRATLALGRIEAKFLEADANKVLAKPKTSKAPTPPPPQARARGSNGAYVSVAPDTDNLEDFEAAFFAKKK